SSGVESFDELDRQGVARTLADRLAHCGLHWELVRAVTQRHEGADERVPVDGAPRLHEPARTEGVGGAGHDEVSPAARLVLCCMVPRNSLSSVDTVTTRRTRPA